MHSYFQRAGQSFAVARRDGGREAAQALVGGPHVAVDHLYIIVCAAEMREQVLCIVELVLCALALLRGGACRHRHEVVAHDGGGAACDAACGPLCAIVLVAANAFFWHHLGVDELERIELRGNLRAHV